MSDVDDESMVASPQREPIDDDDEAGDDVARGAPAGARDRSSLRAQEGGLCEGAMYLYLAGANEDVELDPSRVSTPNPIVVNSSRTALSLITTLCHSARPASKTTNQITSSQVGFMPIDDAGTCVPFVIVVLSVRPEGCSEELFARENGRVRILSPKAFEALCAPDPIRPPSAFSFAPADFWSVDAVTPEHARKHAAPSCPALDPSGLYRPRTGAGSGRVSRPKRARADGAPSPRDDAGEETIALRRRQIAEGVALYEGFVTTPEGPRPEVQYMIDSSGNWVVRISQLKCDRPGYQ